MENSTLIEVVKTSEIFDFINIGYKLSNSINAIICNKKSYMSLDTTVYNLGYG